MTTVQFSHLFRKIILLIWYVMPSWAAFKFKSSKEPWSDFTLVAEKGVFIREQNEIYLNCSLTDMILHILLVF